MRLKFTIYTFALFLSLLLVGSVQADPPARVGRISYLEGAASLHSAGWSQQEQKHRDRS